MDEKYKHNVVVSRGIRNNNPGNIKISKDRWLGQVPPCDSKDKVFCQFVSIDFGIRALCLLLSNYIIKGYNTPRKIINRYAPSSENNTSSYLSFVLTRLGDDFNEVSLDDFIERYSMLFYRLVYAICFYESEYRLTYPHYINIIHNFKLN